MGPIGPIGPKGDQGPKGIDSTPTDVATILLTTQQNDFLNKLSNVIVSLTGGNSMSTVAANAFMNNYPADFPVKVSNSLANDKTFRTSLANTMNSITGANSITSLAVASWMGDTSNMAAFKKDVSSGLGQNTDFVNSVGDSLSINNQLVGRVSGYLSDSNKNATFVSTLLTDKNFIDSISQTLSNNTTYANKLRGQQGVPGTLGTEAAIKENLGKYTMLCTTAGNCKLPNSKWVLNITGGNTLQFTNSDNNGFGNIVLGVDNKSEIPQSTAGSLYIRNGGWGDDLAKGSGKSKFNSAIVNDATNWKRLMIVGNAASGKREIGLWDNVLVGGSLTVNGDSTINGNSTLKGNTTMNGDLTVIGKINNVSDKNYSLFTLPANRLVDAGIQQSLWRWLNLSSGITNTIPQPFVTISAGGNLKFSKTGLYKISLYITGNVFYSTAVGTLTTDTIGNYNNLIVRIDSNNNPTIVNCIINVTNLNLYYYIIYITYDNKTNDLAPTAPNSNSQGGTHIMIEKLT